MALLLGTLVVGFASWQFASEFSHVREIYFSLPAEERGHFGRFLTSLMTLTLVLMSAVMFVRSLVGGSKKSAIAKAPGDYALDKCKVRQ